MSELQTANALLMRICTDQNPVGIYADFEPMVRGLMETTDPVELESFNTDSQLSVRAQEAIISARCTDEYLGSGALLIANKDGVLAYVYNRDAKGGDQVEQEYRTKYKWMSFLKAGRAGVLGALKYDASDLLSAYPRLEHELVTQGKAPYDETVEGSAPHTLGYDWVQTAEGLFVAGASGILPSKAKAQAMNTAHADIVARDQQRGWVNWKGDQFAGWYDLTAARAALGNMVGQGPSDIPPVTEMYRQGMLVH